MQLCLTTTLTFMTVVSFCRPSGAQTVQLPVFEQIGVQTQVIVPDRGGVYLGGVKRAREGRSSTPFGLGSSIGRELSHTGLSAHVYISDLHEMDELILNTPDHGYSFGVRFVAASPFSSRFRDHTWSRSTRYVQSIGRISGRPSGISPAPHPPIRASSGLAAARKPASRASESNRLSLDASRSLRLGQQAEQNGKPGLAILHYRTASQMGSTVAQKRRAALGDSVQLEPLASTRQSQGKFDVDF